MEQIKPTTKHTKHRIGHALISVGAICALALSLGLNIAVSRQAMAFGASEVASLSNQARLDNGLPILNTSVQLSLAAQAKAEHMLTNKYFEHNAPDGTTGWVFIKQQGYAYSSAGENLAASNETAAAVVNGWLNSPGHRVNLLSTTFTEVGYGIVYYGEYEGYQNVSFVVALYGDPIESEAPLTAQETSSPPTPQPTTIEPIPIEDRTRTIQLSTTEVSSGTLTALSDQTVQPLILVILGAMCFMMIIVGSVLELRHILRHRDQSSLGIRRTH